MAPILLFLVATEGAWLNADPRVGSLARDRSRYGCRASSPIAATDSKPLANLSSDARRKKSKNLLARLFGKKDEPAGPLSSGLDEALKSAPIPFRLAGSLLKPLVSALDDAMADAQEDQAALLRQARSAMRMDPGLTAALGSDIEVGGVFSQSSSSVSMDGRGQRQLQLQFQVQAQDRGSTTALAQGASDSDGMRLTRLVVQTGGGQIEVSLVGAVSSADRDQTSDSIVDVEVEVL